MTKVCRQKVRKNAGNPQTQTGNNKLMKKQNTY